MFGLIPKDEKFFVMFREMSHNISVERISNVSLNKIKIEDFKASNYFTARAGGSAKPSSAGMPMKRRTSNRNKPLNWNRSRSHCTIVPRT